MTQSLSRTLLSIALLASVNAYAGDSQWVLDPNGGAGSAPGMSCPPSLSIDADGPGQIFVNAPTYTLVEFDNINAGVQCQKQDSDSGTPAHWVCSQTTLTQSESGGSVYTFIACQSFTTLFKCTPSTDPTDKSAAVEQLSINADQLSYQSHSYGGYMKQSCLYNNGMSPLSARSLQGI